ncbi:MAG: type IV pilin protein [Ruminococcus callidus]
MKTPMNVFNTAMKKKKKNRKGFSLVELIVVLVIMAILSAALIPSLIGYISKTIKF